MHMEAKQIDVEQPTKIWNRTFVSIFVVNMMMHFSMQISSSIVAKYADYLGASARMVGIISSAFAITALLLKVVAGPAIDTYNRKHILMGAMGILSLAYFGFSLSRSTPALFTFNLLMDSGRVFTAACCLALAADALPGDKLGAGIGYFSLAQAICQAVAPSAALFLVDEVGYAPTFALAACLMLLAIVLATRIRIPFTRTREFKISLDSIIAREALIPMVLMIFLVMTSSVVNSFLIVYAGRLGVENIGLYFTVHALTLLVSRPLVGRLSDKYGQIRVLIPAMCCFAGSFFIISFASSLSTFLLAGFVAAFGFGACQPAVQALCMKSVPKERRGAGSSMTYIGFDVGNLTGPVMAGILVDTLGFGTMWRVMTVPIFFAAAIVFVFRARIRRFEEGAVARAA